MIAAGFDRWDGTPPPTKRSRREKDRDPDVATVKDLFAADEPDLLEGEDDFDVPSFLK